jgi:hypothetical protein
MNSPIADDFLTLLQRNRKFEEVIDYLDGNCNDIIGLMGQTAIRFTAKTRFLIKLAEKRNLETAGLLGKTVPAFQFFDRYVQQIEHVQLINNLLLRQREEAVNTSQNLVQLTAWVSEYIYFLLGEIGQKTDMQFLTLEQQYREGSKGLKVSKSMQLNYEPKRIELADLLRELSFNYRLLADRKEKVPPTEVTGLPTLITSVAEIFTMEEERELYRKVFREYPELCNIIDSAGDSVDVELF